MNWRRFTSVLALWAACWLALSGAAASLPLEVGKRWELASGGAGPPMSVEVTGREGDAFVVRWENPWVGTVFHFRLAGSKVLLAALEMGGTGLARMPADTVYFDLDAAEGSRWKNTLGTIGVTGRGRTAGAYRDGIEFELTDPKGARTYWTLSPTGGFVGFGRGSGAYVLARSSGPADRPVARQASAQAGDRVGPGTVAPNRVRIGIDANPPPTEGYTEAAKRARVRMAVQAGASYMYIHPKWTEAEPSAGRYDHAEVDFKTRMAEEFDLPVSLNFRIIDTNQRAIPDAYKGWRFNDDRMAAKLQDLLRAVAPRTRGRVKWITIGNEANLYFDARRGEIADYAELMRRVLPTVREVFPGAQFTINFTHSAIGSLNTVYRPLYELCDIASYTYYPMNANFTFQDPERAPPDIDAIVASAGSKRVLFQEIGYASGSRLGSSEERQARFLANVFESLRRQRDRVIAANFVWMSDLPQSVVDDLGRYYSMSDAENFKTFLGSLGYFDRDGRPKKAWGTFAAEAARMQ